MTGQPEVDLSNYILASLVAAIVLLALAGPTNTPVWFFLALMWTGLGVVLHRVNEGPQKSSGGPH